MLDAVTELPQHAVGNIQRVLSDKVNPDTFRADKADYLLDFSQQRLRGVSEQQMRFVEEEHQLRLLRIADFRQMLKQLRQQPQQEHGVELRLIDKLIRRQQIDDAVTVLIGLHQVIDIKHRLAKELIRTLAFQR